MLSEHSLQDNFLQVLSDNKTLVSIFLVNGIKLQGLIESFDKYVIVLKSTENQKQMIFKHAISTIMAAQKNSATHPHHCSTVKGTYTEIIEND